MILAYQNKQNHLPLLSLASSEKANLGHWNIIRNFLPTFHYNHVHDLQLYDEEKLLASNKGRAYFGLSGYHFNPDDITQLIGLEPTSTDASGAGIGMDKPMISKWEISTDEVSDNVDVYELTDIITKQIEPVKDKILQVIESHNLSPRLGVELTLSVDKGEVCPDVGFGGRTTRLMAEIGAFLNVDYKLSERI